MTISKEAIKAAAKAWLDGVHAIDDECPLFDTAHPETKTEALALAKAALTAALPHLAQPSKSDEERALEVALKFFTPHFIDEHGSNAFDLRRSVLIALTAVRAEASAAEREAIAKWADTWVNAPVNIAGTIRAEATLAERERWTAMPSLARTLEEVRLAEREACAKVADSDASTKGIIIATAIRARAK